MSKTEVQEGATEFAEAYHAWVASRKNTRQLRDKVRELEAVGNERIVAQVRRTLQEERATADERRAAQPDRDQLIALMGRNREEGAKVSVVLVLHESDRDRPWIFEHLDGRTRREDAALKITATLLDRIKAAAACPFLHA